MKINTELSGPLVTYGAILLLSLAVIGVLYPVMSYFVSPLDQNGEHDISGAIGLGIITTSTCGGIGMALAIRRRAYIKNKRSKL